jgi:hypothetical protein
MEELFSLARDARLHQRPWREPLCELFGELRELCSHHLPEKFELFVLVADLHDILLDDDEK